MSPRSTVLAALVALTTGMAVATGPGYARTASTRGTDFAFHGSGFGSRLAGGQLPAGSSTTAYQAIGCTNRAGVSRANDVADAHLPGLGTLSGVRSRVWTSEHHGVVASHARHTIARLRLADSRLGTLSISAIRSTATAWHDASGFHARAATSLGAIRFTPATGAPQSYTAPSPGRPVVIPGLATIYAGLTHAGHGPDGAHAVADALRIDVVASGTSLRIAKSYATLGSGLTYGVFHGHSDAARVEQALGDVVHGGPNPLTLMPCQGTGGDVKSNALAHVDLGGRLLVSGATSAERGNQSDAAAHGVERASIARLTLGGRQLVVKAIVGRASVTRTRDGTKRSIAGSRIGSVVANGREQTFPSSGVLEIPGVARLERNVVTRTPNGVEVIALRLTLLDGSGAVVDLGEAKLGIRPLH
jgi:hypothetical protein